jgi:predicted ArsR family transcriptional regulator
MSRAGNTAEHLAALAVAAILARPGLSTADVAAHVQRTSNQAASLLDYLQEAGWVRSKTQRRVGTAGRPMRLWYPTAQAQTTPYPVVPYTDTAAQVQAALQDGALTLTELRQRVGRPYDTIRGAVRALMKAGVVERYHGPDGVSFGLVDAEEEAWTPAPYLHPIRARALGVAVGRAA